ncbi:14392_t:CDS:2, partial [Dentiscutata heterogama]
MDPLIFTAPARIRILLVPVHPIKAATFHQKVELVKNYTIVKLGDFPREQLEEKARDATICGILLLNIGFNCSKCQLHLNFVTSYEPEHSYLEEFQMHRRIFG